MKLFLSHSSRDKALVREIKRKLPSFIEIWLDEKDLTVGTAIEESINKAIQSNIDYVVVFLGHEAIASKWVQKEIKWAMGREKSIGRIFILPILLDDIWEKITPVSFKKRLYLKCIDQSEQGIKSFVETLTFHLFNLACSRIAVFKEDKIKISNHLRVVYTSRRDMPASKHYFQLIKNIKSSLIIVGVSLNFVIGQSLSTILDILKKDNDEKITLLLFNPKSRSLGFVSKFANKTSKSLRNEINANIETLKTRLSAEITEKNRKRIKVALYDAPPVFSMTLVNQEIKDKSLMLLEFFQYKGDTDDRVSIEVTPESEIYHKYHRSFEILLKESTELNLT